MIKNAPFDVLFEDDSLLIINKPEGIVVDNSETRETNTIESYLENYSINLPRSGIVHRLDKDTSGVLIVAKTQNSLDNLNEQFMNRTIEKEYRALVLGEITERHIRVDAPIKRSPSNKHKFAVVRGGREATTDIEVIKSVQVNGVPLTLVKVFPRSGRTHQIRVHLTSLNHPIVGDKIYMGRKQIKIFSGEFERLMLHSLRIRFIHPIKNKSVEFISDLPEVFDLRG